MLNASQWLDWYKQASCLYSDYQIAKKWEVPPSYISQFRSGRLRIPLANILMMAEATGAEAIEIITALAYHRAPVKHKERIKRAYFDSLLRTVGQRMAEQNQSGYFRRPNR